jgi:hypothetical protein
MCFSRKGFPVNYLLFRRAFYKPGCVLKESRTNYLLGLGEHADDIWFGKWKWKFSAKLPTTTITYRAKVNYFMIEESPDPEK